MKAKLLLSVFVIALLLSCKSDNDTAVCEASSELHGTWSLVNVSGGFAGVVDDFEIGLILWEFNEEDFTITVTNSNTENSIADGYPSGIYYYALTKSATDSILSIENINYDIVTLTNTSLVLDQGMASDGFQFTLSL